MLDGLDAMDAVLAVYKDSVDVAIRQNVKVAYQKLLMADADCRRAKAASLIMNMASLKIELSKFKITYATLQKKVGVVPAIETYIASVQKQIQVLSVQKNNHLF